MAINYGSLQATLTPKGVVSGKVQNATRAFVKDYDLLDNKPKVNGVELSGDKSLDDLGIEIPEIVANPGDTTENLTSLGIDGVNYNIQGSGGSAVTSVNGKTGDVMLNAEDVGALPDDTPIPSELADLSEDSTHRTVTDTEKTDWNAKADISDLPTVNNSTITIQKNNQNLDSFTLNQDSNKSINISVPTKTSDLQNDNSFITNTVNNLANYYLKTQTYTQAEVDALIQATINGRFQKVNSLPASGEPNVIYLVPKTTTQTNNVYDEYIWQDNAWELLGSTEINLSNYVTDDDLTTALQDYLTTSAFNTAIANYYTKTEVGTLLDNKVDKIPGKGLSTYDYDANAKAIVDSVTANLATKVDKVAGKGLSTNDYDNTAKGIVDGVTSALAGKVDKVDGKGLSTNDYTTAEKEKLADISEGANKVEQSETNGNIVVDGTETQVYDDTDITDAISDMGEDIEDMQDELSTDYATVEGNPINFSTLSAQNAVSTSIDLEPIQDLHGYDKPWVGGAGKNLLPLDLATIKSLNTGGTWSGNAYTKNNVTFTIETDTDGNVTDIKLNASNNSSNVDLYLIGSYGSSSAKIPSGTYKCKVTNAGTSIRFFAGYSANNIFTINSESTATSEAPNGIAWAFLRAVANSTINDIKAEPLITLSTETDMTFAPYTNICPISGRTEIGILGCGKNFINPAELEQGSIHYETGAETQNATKVRSGFIEVHNGTYITSIESGKKLFAYRLYDKNKTYLENGGNTNPITINNENIRYIRIIFSKNDETANLEPSEITSAQFELGNQPTQYTAYQSSNDLTISLGQTVYGGTLDVENGVLVCDDVKRILNDDSKWTATAGTIDYIYNEDFSDRKLYESSFDGLSSSFVAIDSSQSLYGRWQGASYYKFGIKDTNSVLTLQQIKDLALADKLEICYKLETPITINLTPHTIKLLEGVNNISTTGDKITLTYRDGKVATLGDLTSAVDNLDSKIDESKILTDTATGDKYILVVTNGVLDIQQVSN